MAQKVKTYMLRVYLAIEQFWICVASKACGFECCIYMFKTVQ